MWSFYFYFLTVQSAFSPIVSLREVVDNEEDEHHGHQNGQTHQSDHKGTGHIEEGGEQDVQLQQKYLMMT